MKAHRVTVLLAEDHAVVREGLRTWLHSLGDFEVVGEAANGREAVALARKLRPAVVVMDLAMPGLNGFEATRQVLRAVPGTKVLVLSAHSDDEYVSRVAETGASGYVLKEHSMSDLVKAIRAVASGKSFFSPSIAKRLRGATARPSPPGPATAQRILTTREAEVLQLVAEGSANKQIALALGISPKTVEKHRQTLMDKLEIHDTAGLTRYAIATGVIESGTGAKIAGAE